MLERLNLALIDFLRTFTESLVGVIAAHLVTIYLVVQVTYLSVILFNFLRVSDAGRRDGLVAKVALTAMMGVMQLVALAMTLLLFVTYY